jgi:hypothetical protein
MVQQEFPEVLLELEDELDLEEAMELEPTVLPWRSDRAAPTMRGTGLCMHETHARYGEWIFPYSSSIASLPASQHAFLVSLKAGGNAAAALDAADIERLFEPLG